MELKYTISRGDIRAFLWRSAVRDRLTRAVIIGDVVAYVGVVIIALLFFEPAGIPPLPFITTLTWFVLGILLMGVFGCEIAAWRGGRWAPARGAHHLTLNSAGINDRHATAERITAWDDVVDVLQTRSHLFVTCADRSTHILPKRDISATELEAFLAELHRNAADAESARASSAPL